MFDEEKDTGDQVTGRGEQTPWLCGIVVLNAEDDGVYRVLEDAHTLPMLTLYHGKQEGCRLFIKYTVSMY